jgi:hypothetical protein
MNAGGRLADHRAARPLLIGQLQERHDRFDACVVNADVDRSELVPDSVDHRLDVRTVGDVPLDRDRPAPGGEERLNDVFSLDEIVHRDIGALRGEYLGDAATDARPAPVTNATLPLSFTKPASWWEATR